MSGIVTPGVKRVSKDVVEIARAGIEGSWYVYKGQVWVTNDLRFWKKVSKINEKDGVVLISWENKDGDKGKDSLDAFVLWMLQSEAVPVMYRYGTTIKNADAE